MDSDLDIYSHTQYENLGTVEPCHAFGTVFQSPVMRLRIPLRFRGQKRPSSLALSRSYYHRIAPSSSKDSSPLHILFCGSEEFSIASLRAIYEEHKKEPGLVASIDVVCRPGKRTGRDLKTIREGESF